MDVSEVLPIMDARSRVTYKGIIYDYIYEYRVVGDSGKRIHSLGLMDKNRHTLVYAPLSKVFSVSE